MQTRKKKRGKQKAKEELNEKRKIAEKEELVNEASK